jgi:uncharacterized membrane protein YedE/YeeE
MSIVNFTPWSALSGGVLIGLAASLLALGSGRIAGISGIAGNLLVRDKSERNWRIAFIAGLIAAPWLLLGAGVPNVIPAALSHPVSGTVLVLAGVLVGLGTRMANGCTSGHGVCGLARLSPRSLIAVLVFMSAGFVTTGLLRHFWS